MGDSVSPYLRMALRDAPKPRVDEPQAQPPKAAPGSTPDTGGDLPTPSEQWRDAPPFARPGPKI